MIRIVDSSGGASALTVSGTLAAGDSNRRPESIKGEWDGGGGWEGEVVIREGVLRARRAVGEGNASTNCGGTRGDGCERVR